MRSANNWLVLNDQRMSLQDAVIFGVDARHSHLT